MPKNNSLNFGFQVLTKYFKKIRVRIASYKIAAKKKAGSQKQEPQSPTPGFIPSNSLSNSSGFGKTLILSRPKRTFNPSEKGYNPIVLIKEAGKSISIPLLSCHL